VTVKRNTITPSGEDSTGELYPRLRSDLEPVPLQNERGQMIFGLRDSLGLAGDILCLPDDLLYILQFFDGRHSGSDIRALYLRRYGTFLLKERFTAFVEQLDDNFLLDNDHADERLQQLTRDFRESDFRPHHCAGQSYPEDADELGTMMEAFFREVKLPEGVSGRLNPRDLKAALVPHIDLRFGGATCAHAYELMGGEAAADLYVILGIGHQGLHHLFSLTGLSFNTPLGLVKTDAELVRRLCEIGGVDYRSEELKHRFEHSIEFQTLFLKQTLTSDFKILPILCSFSHTQLSQNGGESLDSYRRFVDTLRTVLSEYPGRVFFIASVDFAHVGPRYGDRDSPDPAFLAQVERNDRDLIDALCRADRDAFHDSIARTGDRYRICGYPALLTLLDLLPGIRGELLDYRRAVLDRTRSSVTFASMLFS